MAHEPAAFHPQLGYLSGTVEQGRSDNFFSCNLAVSKERPIARADKLVYEAIIGTVVLLNGGTSYDPSGNPLDYRWRFVRVPPTSTVTITGFTNKDDDGSVVSFYPDIVGSYEIELVVSNGDDVSEPALITVVCYASMVPYCKGKVPDMQYMWNFLSDSWDYISDKRVFTTAWSGYTQLVGSLLLDALQMDVDKNIQDIQKQTRRNWFQIVPKIDLFSIDWKMVYGHSVGGDSGITGQLGVPGNGLATDRDTIRTYTGMVSEAHVGKDLFLSSVPTRDGFGTDWTDLAAQGTKFGCSGLSSTRTGIDLNRSIQILPEFRGRSLALNDYMVNFPVGGWTGSWAPEEDTVKGTGTKIISANYSRGLRWFTDSPYLALVEDNGDTPSEFPTGIRAGDFVEVKKGSISGFHKILDIWIYDPADPQTWDGPPSYVWDGAELTEGPEHPGMQIHSDISGTVRGFFPTWTDPPLHQSEPYPWVSAPYAFKFTLLKIDTTSPDGSPPSGGWTSSNFSIFAPLTYLIPGGTDLFSSVVNIPFEVPEKDAEGTLINTPGFIDLTRVFADTSTVPRLIHIQGRTFPIEYNTVVSDITEFAITSIDMGGQVVAGMLGVPWRISNTLQFPGEDFVQQGVSAGDLLVFNIIANKTNLGVGIGCTILGAYNDKIGFEPTIRPFYFSTELNVPENEILMQLVDATKIQGFILEEEGIAATDAFAQEVLDYVSSEQFKLDYYGVDVSGDTLIDAGNGIVFRIEPAYIIRNSTIPVDEDVRSLPCLFEMIDPPKIEEDGDGQKYKIRDDGSKVVVDRLPYAFSENVDYTLELPVSEKATGFEARTNNDEIRLTNAYLLSRGVLPGDRIRVTEGYNKGVFTITKLLGQELAAVSPTPIYSQYGGDYIIERQGVEKPYIRFLYRFFYPSKPVPEILWCESAFLDNSKAVENIHGYKINLNLKDYEDTDAQLDYLSVVKGLMYVLAKAATIGNIHFGISILLGLPAAIYSSKIIEVDRDYRLDIHTGSRKFGRILLEKVTEHGDGTGEYQAFTYPEGQGETREYYEALLGIEDFEGFEFEEEDWYGITINEATGKPWAVGDIVPAYTVLSNGVKVFDYISNEAWTRMFSSTIPHIEALKYHNWVIMVREDLASEAELDIVYDFLFELGRAKHTNLFLVAQKLLIDYVEINDYFAARLDIRLYDQAGGKIQEPLMMEAKSSTMLPLYFVDSNPFVQLTPMNLRKISLSEVPYGDSLLGDVRAEIIDLEYSEQLSGADTDGNPIYEMLPHITGGFNNRMFMIKDELPDMIEPDILVIDSAQDNAWKGYYHIVHRFDEKTVGLSRVDESLGFGPPPDPVDPYTLFENMHQLPEGYCGGAIQRRIGPFVSLWDIEIQEVDTSWSNQFGQPYTIIEFRVTSGGIYGDGEHIPFLASFIAIGDVLCIPWTEISDAQGQSATIIGAVNEVGDTLPSLDRLAPYGDWSSWGVYKAVINKAFDVPVGTRIESWVFRRGHIEGVVQHEGCVVHATAGTNLPNVELSIGDYPLPSGILQKGVCCLILNGVEYEIIDVRGDSHPRGYYLFPEPLNDDTDTFIEVLLDKQRNRGQVSTVPGPQPANWAIEPPAPYAATHCIYIFSENAGIDPPMEWNSYRPGCDSYPGGLYLVLSFWYNLVDMGNIALRDGVAIYGPFPTTGDFPLSGLIQAYVPKDGHTTVCMAAGMTETPYGPYIVIDESKYEEDHTITTVDEDFSGLILPYKLLFDMFPGPLPTRDNISVSWNMSTHPPDGGPNDGLIALLAFPIPPGFIYNPASPANLMTMLADDAAGVYMWSGGLDWRITGIQTNTLTCYTPISIEEGPHCPGDNKYLLILYYWADPPVGGDPTYVAVPSGLLTPGGGAQVITFGDWLPYPLV